MFDGGAPSILLHRAPTDMRRSIDGLAILVADHLGMKPQDGSFYVFVGRRRDKIKILYWRHNGFCLWYKRLEKERFHVAFESDSVTLSEPQLRWLLDGLDYSNLRGHKALNYQTFC